MACSCNQGKGATAQNPSILGDDVGDTLHVRATVSVLGARSGELTWVRGSHVPGMLQAGWLQLV